MNSNQIITDIKRNSNTSFKTKEIPTSEKNLSKLLKEIEEWQRLSLEKAKLTSNSIEKKCFFKLLFHHLHDGKQP